MKKLLLVVMCLFAFVGNCFAGGGNGQLKFVQVYVEGSSVWEQKTLDEFKSVLSTKFPNTKFDISISQEFAASVEVYRDEEEFFTSSDNKSLALRTGDWQKITVQNPCDYVMYCKIVRGDAKAKKNFFTKTAKVEMDCSLRVFNVAKGVYTYATKYRTIGKAHNTSNYERAERHAVLEAFGTMNFDINKI